MRRIMPRVNHLDKEIWVIMFGCKRVDRLIYKWRLGRINAIKPPTLSSSLECTENKVSDHCLQDEGADGSIKCDRQRYWRYNIRVG